MNNQELSKTLKSAFDPFYEAPLEAWEAFSSFGSIVEVKKNTVLKEQNTKEKYCYFVLKGGAGVFIWKELNWACLDLGFENSFFCDYMSLLLDVSSPLRTETLEPCTLFKMKREDFMTLRDSDFGLVITRFAGESSFVAKQQQQIDLLTKTAEQRYVELLNTQPEIVKRVAQKHLASFLNVTPQSLSRIRRKIMELP